MARPLRIEFPGALRHVIVRGNERKAVFRDDADRIKYLASLAHYREKFGFRLLAYCLMDNHVHLAIETAEAPLSRVMAGLQTSYTQYFNRRHARVGHLFQGRYKAFLVERDRHALALLRYIHENPVEAGLAARCADYAWSSDRYYRRGKGPEWLDIDRLLAMLGRGRSAATRGYRRLMREQVDEPYESLAAWGQAVKGDERFADQAFRRAGELPVVRRTLTVEAIAREIARREEVDVAEMMSLGQGRRGSRARALAAWAGREVAGISIARTAKYFRRDTSTMARGVGRLEGLMQGDRRLRQSIEDVVRILRA
jgi:putative transposase